MAVCAGCLKEVENSALAERGLVTKRRYCEECQPVVDEFLRKRDALHTKLAEDWKQGLWVLSENYFRKLKGLPDV